ncbi:MAG: hypothetical protein IPG01_05045 [Chitinophagaceae bacterium]|nr:hypothetical protein [Chitinophagaceae bacterium]
MRNINASRFFIVLLLLGWFGCSRPQQDTTVYANSCADDTSEDSDSLAPRRDNNYNQVRGALLGTRFSSFEELISVIEIEYLNDNAEHDSTIHKNAKVFIRHCSNGRGVISVLESGVSQGDIVEAKDGGFSDRLSIVFQSPYAVSNRKDLERVFLLARLRPMLFGEGDVAFFTLAQSSVRNINTTALAFVNSRDTTEKGYLNTFNHITAQAFITSCFSEELADFVADAHERYHHPQLILGKFTEREINDLEEGPVDNYVDIINNEWGQELGKQLKAKYAITRKTWWTPELLANYLNDLQHYYSWSFQIGFKPFKAEDEAVIKFSRKLNAVLNTKSFGKY